MNRSKFGQLTAPRQPGQKLNSNLAEAKPTEGANVPEMKWQILELQIYQTIQFVDMSFSSSNAIFNTNQTGDLMTLTVSCECGPSSH